MSKKSITETIADNVKVLAASIEDAVSPSEAKLYERIVPIPPVATFSELPFKQIEGEGKPASKARKAAPASRTKRAKKSARKAPAKVAKSKKRKASRA